MLLKKLYFLFVQELRHLCPDIVLLSAKTGQEKVKTDVDFMGLYKANNIGFNEPFRCCLHDNHTFYRVVKKTLKAWAPRRMSYDQVVVSEEKFCQVMCQINLLELLGQHLSRYMHEMRDCHEDQKFIEDQKPEVSRLVDLPLPSP